MLLNPESPPTSFDLGLSCVLADCNLLCGARTASRLADGADCGLLLRSAGLLTGSSFDDLIMAPCHSPAAIHCGNTNLPTLSGRLRICHDDQSAVVEYRIYCASLWIHNHTSSFKNLCHFLPVAADSRNGGWKCGALACRTSHTGLSLPISFSES